MRTREAAHKVRHDLGKYVHLEARWLGEDSTDQEYRDALRTDLLRTRRGPDGDEDCVTLWARLRPEVAELDTRELDALIAQLGEAMRALDALPGPTLRRVSGVAREAAEACRRLGEREGGN